MVRPFWNKKRSLRENYFIDKTSVFFSNETEYPIVIVSTDFCDRPIRLLKREISAGSVPIVKFDAIFTIVSMNPHIYDRLRIAASTIINMKVIMIYIEETNGMLVWRGE